MSGLALDAIFAAAGVIAGMSFATIVNFFGGRRSFLPVMGLRGAYWTIVVAGALFAIVLRSRPPAGRVVFDGQLHLLGVIAFLAALYLLTGLMALVLTGQMWSLVPDRIILPGIAVGLTAALFVPTLAGSLHLSWLPPSIDSLASSFAGAAVGAGMITAVVVIYRWVRKQEGMGQGCIKLMGFIGAFTGPWGVCVVLVAASLTGSVMAILQQVAEAVWKDFRFDPRRELDFSSLLAFYGILFFFQGEALRQHYVSLM
jgi:prepilin signal peptidase PulO-like enzyme (type II secretory pathway)